MAITNSNDEQVLARIKSLFNSIMEESDQIPAAFRPVAKNLVNNFLKRTQPSQVRAIIERVRDEIIPWILHGDIDEPQVEEAEQTQ